MPPVLVKHLMSSPVVSLFAEQTLPLANDIMRFKHLRHLPVITENGRLVGLLTHRDLLRAEISSLTGLTSDQQRARQENISIRQIMTRDVWTVEPDALASVAGRTLCEHKFGCLPVVDLNHVLIGIITEGDFLKLAVRAIEIHDSDPHTASPHGVASWVP